MERFIISSLFALAVLLSVVYVLAQDSARLPFVPKSAELKSIFLGDIVLFVDVADNPAERAKGLSGRTELQDGRGMLFVFPEAGNHGIWMKDMNFGIDILWLDGEGKVLAIKDNAIPESYPEVFRPTDQATYVLEMNEEFTETFGVKEGSYFNLGEL